MNRTQLILPVVLVSIIAATVFGAEWLRDRQRIHRLAIAAGSQEGEYYAFAQALSQVVAEHQPDIEITVLETEGSQQNLDLLQQQQAQLAIVQSDTPPQPSARAVAYLFPEIFHVVARTDAEIENFSDLRGKRVALMPEGSGSYKLFWALSRHYGLTEEFTSVVLPPDQAYAALQRGDVDALSRVMALGNPTLRDLLQTTPAELVGIDQVEALQLSLPYLEAAEIPKGTYDGSRPTPPENLPVVSVRALLITHTDVNPEVVRKVTATLFEFRNELVAIYPRAATMRLPESMENLGLPLHPGARSYYDQDRPFFVNFLVEYAESIGLLMSVSILSVSGIWQFRLWLEGRQKNRADMYNLEILELIEQVQTIENLQELEASREHLFEILRKVVVDLDKDRITAESFQSFTFPWEVAITTLRHRETLLLNLQSPPDLPLDAPLEEIQSRLRSGRNPP